MKNFFNASASLFLAVAILFSALPFPAHSAEKFNGSCVMDIRSGWNLVGLAELTCGLLEAGNGNSGLVNFPAYLDVYGYDGSEYIYGRFAKDQARNAGGEAFEKAAKKYLNNLTKKITSGEFSDFEEFMRKAANEIMNNNTAKMKEYAGRLSKETFTSVWVYNPGRNFKIEYSPRYSDEQAGKLAIRALSTDISSFDLSALMDFIEKEVLPQMLREFDREPGYASFAKEIASGKIILDSGWNFLTYSRLLSDNSGKLNFGGGNCSISRAYLFDDKEKKWVSADKAERSMIGSGMIVYNKGSKCNLIPNNSMLNWLQSLFRDGSDNNPPSLPESSSNNNLPPSIPN